MIAADEHRFPAGLPNVFVFAIFNALSFQIVLGGPMVLYAKSLGASATVLGIIAGMMPLLVIFQIPAAKHVSRVGYKKFVFAGWGTRVGFIFAIALIPLGGGFLDAATQLVLVLAALFAFNLSRGISSAAWLPWIQSRVPAAVRGRYLARDAACGNLASCLSFIIASLALGTNPRPWQFAALFAWSGLMGYARHSMPQIGRLPNGLWYGMGFGGHGVAPTTLAGEVLASAISGQAPIPQGFAGYGLAPTHGLAGRAAAQASYWWLQWRDALRARA